jgi:hypothetical protein
MSDLPATVGAKHPKTAGDTRIPSFPDIARQAPAPSPATETTPSRGTGQLNKPSGNLAHIGDEQLSFLKKLALERATVRWISLGRSPLV